MTAAALVTRSANDIACAIAVKRLRFGERSMGDVTTSFTFSDHISIDRFREALGDTALTLRGNVRFRGKVAEATLDSLALYSIFRRAKAGRVEQTQGDSAKIHPFLDGIARGAMHLVHNRTVKSEHPIEQTRFSCIGRAKDHDAHILVVARTPNPRQQVAFERDRERVHLLRAVQPDERNLRLRLLVLDQHVPPCGEAAWRRSEPRSTLPVGVSGSESTNSMRRGYW